MRLDRVKPSKKKNRPLTKLTKSLLSNTPIVTQQATAKNDLEIESATIKDIITEEKKEENIKIEEAVVQAKKEATNKNNEVLYWDYDKSVKNIPYFDVHCTYEASGYRPIDGQHGLDFDPSPFLEVRKDKDKTGYYCQFVPGSKLYNQFWDREYKRCREGLTINGYTITGPHYFFLNYCKVDANVSSKVGQGQVKIFPDFRVYQYEFFHYYELCRIYGWNCAMLKNRSCGFSEIVASIIACTFICYSHSVSIITANLLQYVVKTMSKVSSILNFQNAQRESAFSRPMQVKNNQLEKKASYLTNIDGQYVEVGPMSLIEGLVADDSKKVRGDRADLVIYEEAGSNPILEESLIKGEELINVGGVKRGLSITGGTGGDSKGAEGLRKLYETPTVYNVLPFKHNYTTDGEEVLSCFFIPAYKTLNSQDVLDNRGWCNEEKAKEFYQQRRDQLANQPSALLKYCAEQCFTADEALSLEGSNKFNRTLLANQIAYIRTHRGLKVRDEFNESVDAVPIIQTGELKFLYKDSSQGIKLSNIRGVDFIPGNSGSLHVLEKPIEGDINNLYVAGIDAIDIGQEQTSDATTDPSKFCIIIFKRAFGVNPPKPVAYYLERPDKIDRAFQTALKLMYWYNAKVNIEATRLSCWNYAKARGFANYFMYRPRATYMDTSKRHSRTIGTPATPTIIDHQNDLIANYVEEFCDQIWFPELLNQLTRYSLENKNKFDMVAAFSMALLADEELQGMIPRKEESVEEWQDIGFYYDDNGIKRWGIIPKQNNINIKMDISNNYTNYVYSSDPRKNESII